MKITIGIICSTDHSIEKCLYSIPNSVPILVILNYPDEFVLNVCKKDKRVTIVRCDERNLGKLRQLAVDNCKTEGICFIDSDCTLESDVVEKVENDLEKYEAVNIPIRYNYYNINTKITSYCRLFNTPDKLLFMPFAFRKSLQKKIGTLFNKELYWGEDTDQRLRMNEKHIEYGIADCIVHHKALTIKEDAKSAYRLGRGTYLQVKNGIVRPRKLLKDLSIIHEIKNSHKCHRETKSFLAGLYHFFIWRPAYKIGYYKTRRKLK